MTVLLDLWFDGCSKSAIRLDHSAERSCGQVDHWSAVPLSVANGQMCSSASHNSFLSRNWRLPKGPTNSFQSQACRKRKNVLPGPKTKQNQIEPITCTNRGKLVRLKSHLRLGAIRWSFRLGCVYSRITDQNCLRRTEPLIEGFKSNDNRLRALASIDQNSVPQCVSN